MLSKLIGYDSLKKVLKFIFKMGGLVTILIINLIVIVVARALADAGAWNTLHV